MAPLEDLGTTPDLATLDAALERLAVVHRRSHDVVELRFFGGLSIEETAVALEVSPDTVKRDWRFAKLRGTLSRRSKAWCLPDPGR